MVDFYEFYEGLQEGWDGPALLVFSDGNHVGARLDRNGLRPARYWVTSDNHIFVASEVRSCSATLRKLPYLATGADSNNKPCRKPLLCPRYTIVLP